MFYLYIQDISNSTYSFWKLYFPHLVPYTSISPPLPPKKPLRPFLDFFISLNCTVIHPVAHAKNLRAYLPFIPFFLTAYFQPINKSYQFYPQNTPQRHSHPSLSIASSAIQATIISHMDYCNHYQ